MLKATKKFSLPAQFAGTTCISINNSTSAVIAEGVARFVQAITPAYVALILNLVLSMEYVKNVPILVINVYQIAQHVPHVSQDST